MPSKYSPDSAVLNLLLSLHTFSELRLFLPQAMNEKNILIY